MPQPNILYMMTDQQRFDTIAALGNEHIYTPNFDRLVRRGVAFRNGYTTCPVCVPARYTIRTGCEPPTTRVFSNGLSDPVDGQADTITGRCGPYLPQTMADLGYRTFGIGKSHTVPWDEQLGYEVHLHSEELYGSPDQRRRDAYASWIADEHPEFDFIEGLMGERTEMYYMPQMSPMPAESTVEWWVADRVIEQLHSDHDRPYFGFVSFIGPHPPFAPPLPFNRLYDPDDMPMPVRGDAETDLMDEQLKWMNRMIWADDISDARAQALKARYYGEITYIDHCIGRILDALESRPDADNTLICFFADHGDMLGDHRAWQKETFFESACHIPFLVSWPERIAADERRDELVCLTDLFGIATGAAGEQKVREGMDVLGMLDGQASARDHVVGYYGEPGTALFKIMVRDPQWKYIYMANGGREQLFDMENDPNELDNRIDDEPEKAEQMRRLAASACDVQGARDALDGSDLKTFEYTEREAHRIYQFDRSRGVAGFPEHPKDVLDEWEFDDSARTSG